MNEIQWPIDPTEFEIQAELYWKLKGRGLLVRGEIIAWVEDDGPHRCKLDLVIYDGLRRAIAIIEAKSYKKDLYRNHIRLGCNTQQGRRYSKFGVPVFCCPTAEKIPVIEAEVLKFVAGKMQDTKLLLKS